MMKMRKRKWKMMAIMIAVILCLGTPVMRVSADDSVITPMSVSSKVSTTLSLSGGNITAGCKVMGDGDVLTKIIINMYLQKQNSSGGWATYKSWSGTSSSNYYNMSKTCAIVKGTYRLRVSATVYKGTSSETIARYSGTLTY